MKIFFYLFPHFQKLMNAWMKRSAKLMQHASTQKVFFTAIVTAVSQKKKGELARTTMNAWKRCITVTRTLTVKMSMGHFLAIAMEASQGMALIAPVRKTMILFNQTFYSLRKPASTKPLLMGANKCKIFHPGMLV